MKQRIATAVIGLTIFFAILAFVSDHFFEYQCSGDYFFGAARNVSCDRRMGK